MTDSHIMIAQETLDLLNRMQELVDKLNASNSTNDKTSILKTYKDDMLICRLLHYVYSPYKQFNLTSKSVMKQMISGGRSYYDIFTLLDHLAGRVITGNDAIACVQATIAAFPEHKQLILNIIDKDLKIRMNAKNINKAIPNLIPEFSVALCNVYADQKHKVDFEKDDWYASRKLDGCRCVSIVYEDGHCECWSRQGKRLETLGKIEQEISGLGLKNVVFDGECCIVDENGDEHFDWVMKEIKKKNHTIEHPMYQVFDMLTMDEFEGREKSAKLSGRYETLLVFFRSHPELKCMKPVKQTRIDSEEHFNQLFNEAKEKDWEGLVIRKDVPYEGKRSNNMLKCKGFEDAEYVVEGAEYGPFRIIEDGKEKEVEVLSNVIISHKGNKVSVGSGFSLDERKYYAARRDEIVGKTITVQYFEETTNRDGGVSLRFPTVKHIYEDGRDL